MNNQELIERVYSRRALMQALKEDIEVEDAIMAIYSINEYRDKSYSYASKNKRIASIEAESIDIAYHLIASILRCNGAVTSIQSICVSLAPILSKDHIEGIKTASEIISICKGRLYSLLNHDDIRNSTKTLAVLPYATTADSVLCRINEFMYIPPLIIKPKKWQSGSNRGGGLHFQNESCILGRDNHHELHQSLDVLNILQSIKWVLDPKILAMEEEPSKPLNTDKKLNQFNIFKNASRNLYNQYTNICFYFMWKYDKRGRSTMSGYHINLQSYDYKKSILSFEHKEVITRE